MKPDQIDQPKDLAAKQQPSQTPGWGTTGTVLACPDCQSTYFVTGQAKPAYCPVCLKSNLSSIPSVNELVDKNSPELITVHKVDNNRINAAITTFSSGIPYPPEDLTPANLAARIIPVFLPAWLIDTHVEARWQAEMGFDYEVVSHRERFDQNAQRWLTQEIKEIRIGWEPRTGRLVRNYSNVGAPAIENDLSILSELGGFHQNDVQNYRSDLVQNGAYIKLPTRIQSDAWNDATIEIHRLANEECRIAGGADHIRNFKWVPSYSEQNWTLNLKPIYSSYYLDDDRNRRRVWIHGTTGKITGIRKSSMKRAQGRALMILIVAAVLFFVGLVIAGIGLVFPPALILGGLVLLAASITGLAAIYPVFQSWQFNR